MDFYYNSLCHICKEFQHNLKRCSSCKSIAYCSKEHQAKDWKKHKEICKALLNISVFLKLKSNCEYSEWRSYRTSLQFYLEKIMKRKLQLYESQMWMFPRSCAVCHSFQNLKDCQSCLCVAYCSLEHETFNKESHKLHCSELRLCLDYDRFCLTNMDFMIDFKPFSKVVDLPNKIQDFSDMLNLPEEVTHVQRVFLTDIFASFLTIVFGLQKCKILSNHTVPNSKLMIHLVGADVAELSLHWKYNIQFLQHWIQNLKICNFVLIGPNCKFYNNDLYCSDKIKIDIITDFYHNVVDKLESPDMIVILNSGLHEFESIGTSDTWSFSLSKLIRDDCPLLLTSYTKNEMEKDLGRLEPFNPKVILNNSRNPFSNMRPIRDWDSAENAPFYVNAYIAIISGPNYGTSENEIYTKNAF